MAAPILLKCDGKPDPVGLAIGPSSAIDDAVESGQYWARAGLKGFSSDSPKNSAERNTKMSARPRPSTTEWIVGYSYTSRKRRSRKLGVNFLEPTYGQTYDAQGLCELRVFKRTHLRVDDYAPPEMS